LRILILCHAFNGLTQRLYAELAARGHELAVEFDIADAVAEEAVALFDPELILAPYLRRAIPASIWSRRLCLVVHPGIVGDRGPAALDRAILRGERRWGVTVLQANAEMDGGDVWASVDFDLPATRKGSAYRRQVTEAALAAVLIAIERWPDWRAGRWRPTPLDYADPAVRGRAHPPLAQAERAIDWAKDDTATVLRKIDAADGFPGVADALFGEPCQLFDACAETALPALFAVQPPGALLARRETALLRRTVDGAVWIGHLKRAGAHPFKLPATLAFAEKAAALPEWPLPGDGLARAGGTWQDIWYEEFGAGPGSGVGKAASGAGEGRCVGFLHFDFYNGAMSTPQCRRLLAALQAVLARAPAVLVLAGGRDFWSNGIHLNVIEAAEAFGSTPADESWANIEAIDDLAQAIIAATGTLTVAALAGNCGAGGCFLARAADFVWAREGVVLNPHYKNMGNLYGSEYWTYLLPPRVGQDGARAIMQDRLPLLARRAVDIGFIDDCFGGAAGGTHAVDHGAARAGDAAAGRTGGHDAFRAEVARRAAGLATAPDHAERLAAKRARRAADEAAKPLAAYRAEELAEMRRNFYGFDPSFHVARYHFVMKTPHSWTPRHLARHRELPPAKDSRPAIQAQTSGPRREAR
jgi:putative two-component system hydrogenase maturation factor HypX/HoxX